MNNKEKIVFAKRLSFLVHAGVPLADSLAMLEHQTTRPAMKKAVSHLVRNVSAGQSLADSMTSLKKTFGVLAINIVRVGELSGTLDLNLEYLAEELATRRALSKKITGALMYPIVILVATLGLTGLLTFSVFPKILPLFESLHMQLPLATRIVIATINFFSAYGWYCLAGFAIIGGGAVLMYIQNMRIHLATDRWLLALPFSGSVLVNYHMARMCRTMGLLLKTGTPIVDAILITSRTVGNHALAGMLESAAGHVAGGRLLSECLTDRTIIPVMVYQIIAVGEVSGNLSQAFLYSAELCEADVDDATKNLSSILEPALMAFMGLIVGFIALSIITPMYQITQSIHP